MKTMLVTLAPALLLAGCGDNAKEGAAERVQAAAEANAAAAGPTPVALGLSEAQLVDADLVGPGTVELGDIKSLVRTSSGAVEGFLVEIEGSNPDRYVQVPLAGLTVVTRGNDQDVATTMTKQQLDALPDAQLPTK